MSDPLDRVADPLLRLELEQLRDQAVEHRQRREANRRPSGYWVAVESFRYRPPAAAVWPPALVSILLDGLIEASGSRNPDVLLACLDEAGYELAEELLEHELDPERDPPLTDGEVRLLAGISAVSLVDQAREQLEAGR